MFATLVGTNTVSTQYKSLFNRLCEIAIDQGFNPPDTNYRIRPNQLPLEGWTLEQKGPGGNRADFLLAVISPKIPSISPIPVEKTIDGPLFAVQVMDTFFVVSRQDRRDVQEFKDSIDVENSFKSFLSFA